MPLPKSPTLNTMPLNYSKPSKIGDFSGARNFKFRTALKHRVFGVFANRSLQTYEVFVPQNLRFWGISTAKKQSRWKIENFSWHQNRSLPKNFVFSCCRKQCFRRPEYCQNLWFWCTENRRFSSALYSRASKIPSKNRRFLGLQKPLVFESYEFLKDFDSFLHAENPMIFEHKIYLVKISWLLRTYLNPKQPLWNL